MRKFLLVIPLLLLLFPFRASAFGRKPVNPNPVSPPSGGLEKTCPAPGAAQAVDLSEPVNQSFLDAMKKLGVTTVIRYYDHVNETLPGKTLKPSETDLLARNGFDVMVVFQHNNNQIKSFTAARGVSDSVRSLALAAANGQTMGSAIYFGVDGGWSSAADLKAIDTYFSKAAPLIRTAGFRVGAYGSGLVCSRLLAAGLIDFCWLANATGWPGFKALLSSNQWTLKQSLPKDCGGKNVDFDVANAAMRDLGGFRPR